MIRKALLAAALAALPASAVAEETSWEVRILQIGDVSAPTVIVTFGPIEGGAPWVGCRAVTLRSVWSKDRVPPGAHQDALAKLADALKTGAGVRIGEAGPGFRRLGRCVFESRALLVLDRTNGTRP